MRLLLLIIFGLTLSVNTIYGQFNVNLDVDTVHKAFEIIRVKDLVVGDKAHVTKYIDFCVEKNKLLILGENDITGKHSEYIQYYRLSVKSGMKMALEIIPETGQSKKEALKVVILDLVKARECDAIKNLNPRLVKDKFIVTEINSHKSLKELLQTYNKMK